MMPNITRGGDTTGLMLYLVGPGRANEHENPHLIAHGADQVIGNTDIGTTDAVSIATELDTYMNFHGVYPQGSIHHYDYETNQRILINRAPNHVWHCSLSLAPDEPALSDAQWTEIAHDFMREMGFVEEGKPPARWVAVHHGTSKAGGDHIHIVANIVRTDGTRVNLHNDYKRAQATCNKLEHKYALAIVEGREHGRGSINDSAEALNAAAKNGSRLTDRARLETRVRAAATAARNESDFITLVQQSGVRIRPYFAKGTTDVITGYAVALHTTGDTKRQWYGGGRLARDLTLTRLRRRWPDTPLSAAQAAHTWRGAWRGKRDNSVNASLRERLRKVEQVRERIRATDYTDPTALADMTQDVAGIYSAAATQYTGTPLGRQFDTAARQLGRAAQLKSRPRGCNPTHPATRAAANALLLYAATDPQMRQVIIAYQMLRLVKELAALYEQARQTRTAEVLLRDTQGVYANVTRHIDVSTLEASIERKLGELTQPTTTVIERSIDQPAATPQATKPTLGTAKSSPEALQPAPVSEPSEPATDSDDHLPHLPEHVKRLAALMPPPGTKPARTSATASDVNVPKGHEPKRGRTL